MCHITVQVVPLSQRSGIVEWCEGTVPLGEYLVHPSTGDTLKDCFSETNFRLVSTSRWGCPRMVSLIPSSVTFGLLTASLL